MSAEDPPAPRRRGRSSVRTLASRSLVVVGLSGLAVTQPVLGLFGENPEFFAYARADDRRLVLFALLVGIGPALLAVLLQLVAWLVGRPALARATYLATSGALGAVYALGVARQVAPDSNLVAIAAGLAALVGVPLLLGRQQVARAARYLAFTPVLFTGLFLLTSPTARLLWGTEADALDASVGNPVPVVMVLVDELPLSTILTVEGRIDEKRFPGFAGLAEDAVWYPNAAATAPGTSLSVPTMLSGVLSDLTGSPTSVDHPNTLFTLLGGTYDLEVQEEVTALCPQRLCAPTDGDAGLAAGTRAPAGLRSMLVDAWVVTRHLTYPPSLRADLPSVRGAWGGFAGQDEAPPPADDDEPIESPVRAFLDREPEGRAALGQGAHYAALAEQVERRERPTFWFAHGVIPHWPWEVTNLGTRYSLSNETVGLEHGVWGDDERAVVQGFQRHTLQAGYTDRQIALVHQALVDSGLWDEALVIIAADHGAAFEPGTVLRDPVDSTAEELYRVPLFVHYPGEAGGVVDERDAMLVDLVPTVADVLDVRVPWEVDGRSLLLEDPPARQRAVTFQGGPTSISDGMDAVLALTRRNATWLRQEGWRGVYAAGPLGGEVGRAVSALRPAERDLAWQLDQALLLESLDPAAGFVPALLTGTTGDAERPDGWFAVGLNGTVAGTGFVQPDGHWSALVDETLFRSGANHVEVLVPDGAGGWWSPRLPVPSLELPVVEGGEGGVVRWPDGRTVPMVRHDGDEHLAVVDNAQLTDGVLAIGGWSVDEEAHAVPAEVLLLLDGDVRPASERRTARPDLVELKGDEAYARAGFELVANGIVQRPRSVAILAVYADHAIYRPISLD